MATTMMMMMAAAACVAPEETVSEPTAPALLDIVGAPADPGERPRGVYAVFDPGELRADTALDVRPIYAARQLFYMNRLGGTYTPGNNNSATNRSSIPDQTSIIAPWAVSDAGWETVMSCVRDLWAPYDVVITDVDPGDVPHIESVVAGHPNDLGFPNGVGGVSPYTIDCSVIPNSIVYTFAEVYGNDYRAICETIAQEVAHSFGLDHEYECTDPMTYLGNCGDKSFRNLDAPCGEDQPRVCACGDSTQNSVRWLNERIGPADALPPQIQITDPLDGAMVSRGFTVRVSAADNVAVTSVELLVDGALAQTLVTEPFVFSTDPALADGTHVLETRVSDGRNVSTASIAVTVQNPDDPGDPGDPGDPPGGDSDPSDPSDPGDPANPGHVSGDIIGGCTAGGNSGTPAGLALAIALAAFDRRRRRRS